MNWFKCFKFNCSLEKRLESIERRILTLCEELAKHLTNHELQKDIHANCVSQEKVNDIICSLRKVKK